MTQRVFLSAVTIDFPNMRPQLAEQLRRAGFHVVHQEEFVETGDNTLVNLAKMIKAESDIVLHILGDLPGATPPRTVLDQLFRHVGPETLERRFPSLFQGDACHRITYTQWEAWLGRLYDKTVICFHRKTVAPVSDHNLASGMPVREHLQLLKPEVGYPNEFTNDNSLREQVLTVLHRWRNQAIGDDRTHVNPEDLKHLDALCEIVQREWIDGLLNDVMNASPQLMLSMKRVQSLVKTSTQSDGYVFTQQPLDDIEASDLGAAFAQSGRRMLIVGDFGSGKTTVVLKLCQSLLDERRVNSRAAVPVILNLATWSRYRGTFPEWVIDELNARYRVPRRIGRRFVRNGYLVILFDGLDELPPSDRRSCVQAMNQYNEPLHGLVVTCRQKEYEAIADRLSLNVAVAIQPLSSEQMESCFEKLSLNVNGLRDACAADEHLRMMATSPLMLNVMIHTYTGSHAIAIPNPSSKYTLDSLLTGYVAVMCRRASVAQGTFSSESVISTLTTVALTMGSLTLAELRIDNIQPKWLPFRRHRATYFYVTRLLELSFWTMALNMALNPGIVPVFSFEEFLRAALIAVPLAFASACAMKRSGCANSLPPWYWRIHYFTLPAVSLGVLNLLLGAVLGQPFQPEAFVLAMVAYGVLPTLMCPLPDLRSGDDIHPVERMKWSTKHAVLAGLAGTVIGFVFGTAFSVLISRALGTLIGTILQAPVDIAIGYDDLKMGGGFAVAGGLIGVVFGGLRRAISTNAFRSNGAIQASFKNSLTAAWISLLLLLVPIGSCVFVLGWSFADAKAAGTSACGWVAITSLIYGGRAIFRHFVLRAMLACSQVLPTRFIALCEQGRKMGFLRGVGGAYIFIHKELQNHFAGRAGATVTESSTWPCR